jgi:LDH2 family malate/lactate/ureidoglycolate dehydrogenase
LLAQTAPNADGSRRPAVVKESECAALVDGGGRFGFLAAEYATSLAVEKARQRGVGFVGVNNHTFTGALSYYIGPVADAGLVAIASSTLFAEPGRARVAPYGSAEAMLGTNPLAIAVPSTEEPVIWDAATAAISGGKLVYFLESGRELPDGVAIDSNGNPTRDPKAAWDGAIRAWGGYRGAGLSTVLQLLGLLCGVEPFGGEMTFMVIVIDPSVLGDAQTFAKRVTQFASAIRAARPAPGFDAVRMPYDGSRERLRHSEEHGVVIATDVHARLLALAEGAGVDSTRLPSRPDGRVVR